jgi:hypothetical protein
MDNLQRAMDSAEQNPDNQGLLEGVQLVAQQLEAVFQQHHCTRIDAKGKLFDPHLHEAIAQLPSQDVSERGGDRCPSCRGMSFTIEWYERRRCSCLLDHRQTDSNGR